MMGGEGVTPFYFILPNSKWIFKITCAIDGNVHENDPWEYYHDKVEIPIHLDLDYYYTIIEYKDNFYDEYFLYNIDPVFKKVLELE